MTRLFRYTVENGLGDRAHVELEIPDDRHPGGFAIGAIARARRVLPDAKPWRIATTEELATAAPPAPREVPTPRPGAAAGVAWEGVLRLVENTSDLRVYRARGLRGTLRRRPRHWAWEVADGDGRVLARGAAWDIETARRLVAAAVREEGPT